MIKNGRLNRESLKMQDYTDTDCFWLDRVSRFVFPIAFIIFSFGVTRKTECIVFRWNLTRAKWFCRNWILTSKIRKVVTKNHFSKINIHRKPIFTSNEKLFEFQRKIISTSSEKQCTRKNYIFWRFFVTLGPSIVFFAVSIKSSEVQNPRDDMTRMEYTSNFQNASPVTSINLSLAVACFFLYSI